jgi:N-acetylmuramoyl-L-alanine amidase
VRSLPASSAVRPVAAAVAVAAVVVAITVAAFAVAAPAAAASPPAPSVSAPRAAKANARAASRPSRPKLVFKHLKHIVLDPGHGGDNLGAVGHVGTREKVLTLDIANALRAMIEARTDLRVSMTRHDDRGVALRERPRVANALGGDVLVSVHCNSSPDPEVRGMEVWFLAADSSLAAGLEVVRREEGIEPHAPPVARRVGADAVVTAMRLAAAHEHSERFAFALAAGLRRADTKMRMRGVRQAPFGVLKEAEMAAVVFEVGYISNPEEGRHLLLPETHEALARGLLLGLIELDRQLAPLAKPASRSTASTNASARRSSAAWPSPPSSRVKAVPSLARNVPQRRPTP